MRLQCGDKFVDLSTPVVMGVLNVTPDSFSDGGRFLDPAAAIAQATRMVEEGAAIIDVGGESTRPGAAPVTADEELRRIAPVIGALAGRLSVPISVDTCKPEVMRAALDLGVGMINDVTALGANQPLARGVESESPSRGVGSESPSRGIEIVARSRAAVCLMHMQGEPRTMQRNPHYDDVVADVRRYLEERAIACEAAGIARERIVIDPGFGFGKALEHSLQLLRGLERIASLGYPVLVGLSRKSMIGTILDRPVDRRLHGGLALAALAVANGARIVRAHDVAATVDAVRIAAAVRGTQGRD